MKVCYQHFPIVTVVYDEGRILQVKHYLGENCVKRIRLLDGCRVYKINDQSKKDDIWIQGNDIENVSGSCKPRKFIG
jgi:ribosomal protein L6P/L9E